MLQSPYRWPGRPPEQEYLGLRGGVQGIERVLRSYFRSMRFGGGTLERIDPELKITLEIPDWWCWVSQESGDTASIGAGSTTPVVLYTVNPDERNYLEAVWVNRSSGDNTIDAMDTTQSAPFGSGTTWLTRHLVTNPATDLWPRWGTGVAGDLALGGFPRLMEPGTQVRLTPSGAGAGASVFAWQVLVKRTVLVRSRSSSGQP